MRAIAKSIVCASLLGWMAYWGASAIALSPTPGAAWLLIILLGSSAGLGFAVGRLWDR